MSEELQWELYDIFASGIFAFPVYEHSSARRIVRYLLMRGVPDEDVANAIEGHTVDLRGWLSRTGKRMVGEWVIAWLNETREDYQYERRDRTRSTTGKVKGNGNEDKSGLTPKRHHRSRQHRIRDNCPGLMDCSDMDDDDDSFDDGTEDFSDMSSAGDTSSYEGSVTSLSSINSSAVSYRNKPINTNSVTNLQPLHETQSYITGGSTTDLKNIGRLNKRKVEAFQSDSACWLNTDTNSELDGCREKENTISRKKSTRDIMNLVCGMGGLPADADSRVSTNSCSVGNRLANVENTEPIEGRPAAAPCRFSSTFLGFLPHNTSSADLSGTVGMKKRPHSAQTPATRTFDTSTECHCSMNDSASSILSRLSTTGSDLSTNVFYNARSWHQRSPGESPQSLPVGRPSPIERSTIKQCRCTLPHYTRKNFRNILICDRPSRCMLCRNSRPLEELQAAALTNGTKRRKGSAGMFRKISWIT